MTLHERRKPSEAVSTRTIGDVIEKGETLYVNCHDPRCQNSATLDLEALAHRFGREHGAMHDDLVRLFRCTNGRKIGFTCIPDYRSADAKWMRRR